MPFGSGRKGAAEWADLEEIESDKLKVMCGHCRSLLQVHAQVGTSVPFLACILGILFQISVTIGMFGD